MKMYVKRLGLKIIFFFHANRPKNFIRLFQVEK